MRLVSVAGALTLVACGGGDAAMNENLRKDLDLAFTSSEITLSAPQPAAQVVSAIERTAPAPRRIARAQRVPKHRVVPRAVPAPVEVERSDAITDIQPQPVEVSSAPSEVASLPSQRPRPVFSGGTGPGDDRIGAGPGGAGAGIGTIMGVVLRGGVVDGDECDPRTDGRRRGGIYTAVNNRIPVIGTFPGSGRVGTTATIGGMVLKGRSRF